MLKISLSIIMDSKKERTWAIHDQTQQGQVVE